MLGAAKTVETRIWLVPSRIIVSDGRFCVSLNELLVAYLVIKRPRVRFRFHKKKCKMRCIINSVGNPGIK